MRRRHFGLDCASRGTEFIQKRSTMPWSNSTSCSLYFGVLCWLLLTEGRSGSSGAVREHSQFEFAKASLAPIFCCLGIRTLRETL